MAYPQLYMATGYTCKLGVNGEFVTVRIYKNKNIYCWFFSGKADAKRYQNKKDHSAYPYTIGRVWKNE